MYSELIKMTGLSQNNLEFLVLCGIAVAVLGILLVTFWRYILAGIGVLFCVTVLANHVPNEPKEEIISVSKVTEKEVQKETEKDDHAMFIEDCLEFTDYSKKHCEALWSNRETITEQNGQDADLLDVSNKEYKKRRAEALKKKNAVVLHATYHN